MSNFALETTNDIINNIKRTFNLLKNPDILKDLSLSEEKQYSLQSQYLSNVRFCSYPQLESFRDKIPKLDTEDFKNLLRDQFYNPQLMSIIMCITRSIFYGEPIQHGAIEPYQRLRHYFRNLKQIGSESVEGYAISADLEQQKSTFLIKVPRSVDNNLLHEYFIGVFGTNRMRQYVPNFAYVFGGFECSPPVISPDKNVLTWCNQSGSAISYLVYENIQPSISMLDYVKTCTFDRFLDKYLQILFSLNKALEIIDFTHYDLHGNNVLIRSIPSHEQFNIPYQTELGQTEYISTDGVATIIDYGTSHIRYQGHNFGVFNAIPYGVLPSRSYPMIDAYKLLLSCMYSMYTSGNTQVFQQSSILLRFFNSLESPIDIITNQYNNRTYFYLPWTESTGRIGFPDLISYIRSNFDLPFLTSNPNGYILGCNGTDICLTNRQTISELNMIPPLQADSIFEFYDLVTRLTSERRYQDIQTVLSRFNYNQAIDTQLRQFETLSNSIFSQINSINVYTLTNLPLNLLFNPQFFSQYRSYYYKLTQLYDDIQDYQLMYESILYTSSIFNDTRTIQLVNTTKTRISNYYSNINQAISSLRRDRNYLDSLYSSQKSSIDPNSQYTWYWNSLLPLDYII